MPSELTCFCGQASQAVNVLHVMGVPAGAASIALSPVYDSSFSEEDYVVQRFHAVNTKKLQRLSLVYLLA